MNTSVPGIVTPKVSIDVGAFVWTCAVHALAAMELGTSCPLRPQPEKPKVTDGAVLAQVDLTFHS